MGWHLFRASHQVIISVPSCQKLQLLLMGETFNKFTSVLEGPGDGSFPPRLIVAHRYSETVTSEIIALGNKTGNLL